MTYDMSKVSAKTDIFEAHPKLHTLTSFEKCERPDKQKVIRYIILMYDPKSPYITLFQDVEIRKRECAIAAGYDPVANATEDLETKALYEFVDQDFVLMVVEFIQRINNRIWSMIVSNEQVFYEAHQTLLQQVENTKGDKDKIQAVELKSKLVDLCDKTNDRLETYYRKFYGDSETAAIITGKISPENLDNL